MPGSTVFGAGATGFFCSAVAHGSRSIVQLVANPVAFSLVLGGLLLFLIFLLSRTTWRPSVPPPSPPARVGSDARGLRADVRQAVAIVLRAGPVVRTDRPAHHASPGCASPRDERARRSGRARQQRRRRLRGARARDDLTLLGLGLVQAATARALVELDAGRPVGPLRAYRLSLDSARRLFGALLIAVVVVSLLASSIFLLPIAIWLAGRWALVVPVVELEDCGALPALRRSRRLTRTRWLKVASLVVVGGGLVLVLGPLVGALLILGTSAPFWLVNVVAGAIYAVTMPFVAITTAYVYFDCRVRDELGLAEAETSCRPRSNCRSDRNGRRDPQPGA